MAEVLWSQTWQCKVYHGFIRAHIPDISRSPNRGFYQASLSFLWPLTDIIVWKHETEVAHHLKLTVCVLSPTPLYLQTGKLVKYVNLVEVINSTTSYNCHLNTIQFVSWGMIDKGSLSPVKSIPQCTKKHAHQFFISFSISNLTESLKIWSRHNSCE